MLRTWSFEAEGHPPTLSLSHRERKNVSLGEYKALTTGKQDFNMDAEV